MGGARIFGSDVNKARTLKARAGKNIGF